MEPFICELDPELKITLQAYLYQNVKNVETIRRNIIEGCWKCTAVKPSLVASPLQLAVAANKAALAHRTATLFTRTVFAEILYNLSITKNISQSLSKFGIEKDNDILLCFLISDGDDAYKEILSKVEGEAVPMCELSRLTNLDKVKSVYKLNSTTCEHQLLDTIISRIATKNFSTYYQFVSFL